MATRLTVLGAGPGGYVAAVRAAQLGATVTLVEKEQVGGTCLNWGCIPSKIMKTTAEMLERFHQAGQFGIRLDGSAELDMQQLMTRKQQVLSTQIKGIEGLLAHHKVKLVRGSAHIDGPGKASATGEDGQVQRWEWDRLIIATGSQPFSVPAFPFDGRLILSSNHILEIEQVPESMVIVGGGVIGCEFACILSAMGTAVIVVEALDRLLPLPSVDAGCSKVLEREMKKRKIKFYVNRVVESIEGHGDGLAVTIGPSPFASDLKEKDRVPVTETVAQALVCIGRSPNTKDIGLSTLGLATDAKGWIPVDDRLQTGVPGVYAIGDVLGPERVMLAHVASTEAMLAAENAMGRDRAMDYTAVPGAIFTMPEVACVGLTEAQAKAQGIDARADTALFRTIGKAQVIGELAGQATIISESGSGKVLGVHIIGPHATDLLGEGTLAVSNNLSVADIADTIHAHPTLAEIMLEVALKATGKALHG
ncbi:dihydrolipoyl dehydrogenase [Desulfosarcina sp.]|uniref:dihydrolipoyl dehydrogenase n=1 Tax=Desulfosarcina sp. TaxID=2027861 RepID=UPI003561EE14